MRLRYIGDYYKVMFEKGGVYECSGIERAPWGDAYRVYSPAFDDDGLFPFDQFEVVEEDTPLSKW